MWFFQVSSAVVILGIFSQSFTFGIPARMSIGDPSPYLPVRAINCPKRFRLPGKACEVRLIPPNTTEIILQETSLPTNPDKIGLLPPNHPLQHVSWRGKLFKNENNTDVEILLNKTSDGPLTYSIGYYQTEKFFKPCSTPGRGTAGHCKYLAHCVLDVFLNSFETLLKYAKICENEDQALLICCPDSQNNVTIAPHRTRADANEGNCKQEEAEQKRSCGGEPPSFQDRIFGGKPARRWPWITALFFHEDFICGGTLISAKHVLTAAHCVLADKTVYTVRLGEYDFNEENAHRKNYAVSRITKHPEYRQTSFSDDIAIVTLTTPTDCDCAIWRICLPRSGFSHFGSNATIIGWGATPKAITSNNLLQVEIPILTDSKCNATIQNSSHEQKYDDHKMLCAAALGKASCKGDSGGPLMIKVNNQWTIFGIVAGGIGEKCGTGLPGIFTRVDYYYDWIDNIILGEN